jgi:(2Fe-2S) ferredoxin
MASKFVLVCQNVDCMQRGSGVMLEKLKEKLKDSTDIEVKSYLCFGACQQGPNIVLYPQKVWYCGVKDADLDDIANSANGGPVVERLTQGIDPSLKDLVCQVLDAGLF